MDPIAPIPPRDPQPPTIAPIARVRPTDRDGRRQQDRERDRRTPRPAPDRPVDADGEPSEDGRPHVDLTA